MIAGEMVEVKALPHRVPTKWDRGVKMLVEGKWVEAATVWRPAIFAGVDPDGLRVFRFTDSRAFRKVLKSNLPTSVRKPRGSTASQEAYVRDYGELC